MTRSVRWISWLLLAASLGCTCGRTDAPAAPPAEPTTAQETPTPEQPSEPAVQPSQRLSPEQLTELRVAVRDGRRAAGEQRWGEAVTAFDRALAIDPASGQLRCEAGLVHLRAGHLEQAAEQVQRALADLPDDRTELPEPMREQVAMCLYNAGLVHEAREDFTAARDAYQRSLALRPNDTVTEHLRAVEGRAGQASTEVAATSAAELADRIARRICQEEGLGEEVCAAPEGQGAETSWEGRVVPVDARDGEAARGYELRTAMGGMGRWEGVGVIYELGDERAGGVVARFYSPGAGGVSYELERASFEMTDLVPGGARELVATLEWNDNDEDMGMCQRSGHEHAAVVICGAVDEAPRCVAIPTQSRTYWERYEGCEEPGAGAPADDGDGTLDTLEERRTGFATTHRFDGDALVVEPAEGAPITGRHPVLELLRRDDLRVSASGR